MIPKFGSEFTFFSLQNPVDFSTRALDAFSVDFGCPEGVMTTFTLEHLKGCFARVNEFVRLSDHQGTRV